MDDLDRQLSDLMARALEGDAAAYRELLAALAPRLRSFFMRRLSEPADAEDLVQETLIAIHTRRATYDPARAFAPWAYAVARHKLIDSLRRRGRRGHVPLEDAGVLLADAQVEDGAARADLARVLAPLSERQRRLLMDVKVEGLSVAEAAERHGYSVTAAKVAIHRAMKTVSAGVQARED